MGKKKNRIIDDCNHCGRDTEVTPETAYIVELTRCFGNFVLNTCTHCNQDTRLFLDEQTQRVFERKGIPVARTDEIPDPDFIENYLKLKNIPLPETKKLTPEQELEVSKFGGYLAVADVDVTDFER